MESIYNYFEFPDVEKAHQITKDIKDIRIQVKYEIQNEYAYADEFDYYENVVPWINEFNYTMLNIEIPYILCCDYYNKNIPEYNVKDYNEKEYKEIDYINKYYFDYFSRICLFEIKSNFERTIHIISNLFDLRINYNDKKIITKVISYLKNNEKNLYDYLQKLENNSLYKDMELLRNELTHSISPLSTKSLPTFYENGLTVYGIKKSKPSSEIKNIIEASLKLLKEYVDFLGKYIENFYMKKFNRQ